MKKRKAVFLLSLVVLAAVTVVLFALLPKHSKKEEKLTCVTSFYPVYLLAESVAEGADFVQVVNLTENHTGCIHDYTLTTKDMKLLSEAKLFFINGGGMELFLEKAAKEYTDLKIIDTSEGYDFLEGVEHHHDGEEPEHDEEHSEHEHGSENSHIWLSIDGYMHQLSLVEKAFAELDPKNAELYHKNAERCRENLSELKKEYEAAKTELSGKQTVVFHEGFVYLMRMLSVEVLHCMPMDSDTQISAGEAAEIVDECKLHSVAALFAEPDFLQTVTDTFQKETGALFVSLDAITGSGHSGKETGNGLELYCKAMRDNLRKVKEAFSGK